jgi:hypothetical protein
MSSMRSIGLGWSSVSKFDSNKKNRTLAILSNFVKFSKIRYNSVEFQLEGVCTVKTQKTKNRPNLSINRTELAEIRSNSSKIRWNSSGY